MLQRSGVVEFKKQGRLKKVLQLHSGSRGGWQGLARMDGKDVAMVGWHAGADLLGVNCSSPLSR